MRNSKKKKYIPLLAAGINYVSMPNIKTEEEFNLMRDAKIEAYKQEGKDKGTGIGTIAGMGLGLGVSALTGGAVPPHLAMAIGGQLGGLAGGLIGQNIGLKKQKQKIDKEIQREKFIQQTEVDKARNDNRVVTDYLTKYTGNENRMLMTGLTGSMYPILANDGLISQGEIAELEKGELVFKKDNLNNYILVRDFQNAFTHKDGGVITQLDEGDIVIPNKYRDKVLNMIDKNGIVRDRLAFNMLLTSIPNKSNKYRDLETGEIIKGENKVSNKFKEKLENKITIYDDGVNPEKRLEKMIKEYEKVFGGKNPTYDEVFAYFRNKKEPFFVYKKLIEDPTHKGRFNPQYDIKTTNIKGEKLNLSKEDKDFINWYYNINNARNNTNNQSTQNTTTSSTTIQNNQNNLDLSKGNNNDVSNRNNQNNNIPTNNQTLSTTSSTTTSTNQQPSTLSNSLLTSNYGTQNNDTNNKTNNNQNETNTTETTANKNNNTTTNTTNTNTETTKNNLNNNNNNNVENVLNEKEKRNIFGRRKDDTERIKEKNKKEIIKEKNKKVEKTNSGSVYSQLDQELDSSPSKIGSYLPLLGMATNALLMFDNKSYKVGKKYAEMLMAEKPEIRDATYVDFDELRYNDRSQPLRNQLTLQTNEFNRLAQNISGGSVQNLMNMYLSNMGNRMQQLQSIENQEASRLDQINMQNVQIRNQEEQLNKQYYDANVTANEQNRARARDLNRLGYTTLFSLLQMREKDRRTMMQDNLKWISDIQANQKTMHNENLMKILLSNQLQTLDKSNTNVPIDGKTISKIKVKTTK